MKLWKVLKRIWLNQPQGKIEQDEPPRGGYYVEDKYVPRKRN